jgi:hypothetical protein
VARPKRLDDERPCRREDAINRAWAFLHGRAGDAQRVWFPELIERLRDHWRPDISCDAPIELPDRLDAMLQRIRSERQIRPACACIAARVVG